MHDLRGVCSILATPFRLDGSIDIDDLQFLADWFVKRGVHAITTPAIASEVYKLTDRERFDISRAVIDSVAGRVPVVLGTGHPGGTRATIEFSQDAQAVGAAAVLVAPPFISIGSSEQIVDFYRAVAESIAIPVMIQDEPGTTGVHMPPSLLARIVEAAPGCRYAKVEALPTPPKFTQIARLVDDSRLGLFAGTGAMYFIEELQRGARGIVSGLAFPEALVEVWDHFVAGRLDQSVAAFARILPVLRLEAQPGIGLAIRKQLLQSRGALTNAWMREPAIVADDESMREVEMLLARVGDGLAAP